ncbi:hypothetical protein ILYODFUR_030289 [Ilyodon furcidens]|uniref:Uncharacterized protein n=1 Tax=Ilyodon furcidens TaxID=33524 RepID=A0ABV0TYY5_9TELE
MCTTALHCGAHRYGPDLYLLSFGELVFLHWLKQTSATHATHTLHTYSSHLPLSAQWLENKALCNSDEPICETLLVQSYVKFLTVIPLLLNKVPHVTVLWA